MTRLRFTLAQLMAIKPDADLDLNALLKLLLRVENEIHASSDRVRYNMNKFLIALGTYVKPLLQEALASAVKIGNVSVDRPGTACKVPMATVYIQKAKKSGKLGIKRKSKRC